MPLLYGLSPFALHLFLSHCADDALFSQNEILVYLWRQFQGRATGGAEDNYISIFI